MFSESSSKYLEIPIRMVFELIPLFISFFYSTKTAASAFRTNIDTNRGSLLTVDKSKIKGTILEFWEKEETQSQKESIPFC